MSHDLMTKYDVCPTYSDMYSPFLHYSIGHNKVLECLHMAWGVFYPSVVCTIYGSTMGLFVHAMSARY